MLHVFRRSVVALLLTAPLFLAPAAKADLILTFTGNDPVQPLTMHATYTPYDPLDAGVFNLTVNSGGPENGFGPTIRAFCAEIFTDVLHGSPTPYTVVPVADLADLQAPPRGLPADPVNKANYLTELFGRYYASTFTPEGAAAFQYAVWEIMYDSVSDLNVATGNIRFDADSPTANGLTVGSSTAATAQAWLGTLSGDTTQFTNNPAYSGFEVVGLKSVDYQDQIVLRDPPTVPAPPALLLGLLGVAAVAGRTWLSRRKLGGVA